jgi:hypothetical protein
VTPNFKISLNPVNYQDKVNFNKSIDDSKNSNRGYITIRDGNFILDQRISDQDYSHRLPFIS